MTRASLTALGCAILIATPALAQDLPVLRDGRSMCVSLDAHDRDAMVVLVKTNEKAAANLDADRPADALLAAIADGTIEAFQRGTLDTCIATSPGEQSMFVAFSVGDRVTFLGNVAAQPKRRITTRQIEKPGRGGRMVTETVRYVADELLVRVPARSMDMGDERACFTRDAAVTDDRLAKLIGDSGASVVRRVAPGVDGLYVLKGVGVDPYDFCGQPGGLAEPNYIVELHAEPGHTGSIGFQDPRLDECWGMHNTGQTGGTPDIDIDAPRAWRIHTGSPSVVVGVIDTGIDYGHVDLRDRMWTNDGEIPNNGIDDDGNGYIDDYYGYDFANDDGDPLDDHSHGSHVSGTIAASMNNRGVVGVAPQVRLMALKTFTSAGSGSVSDSIEATLYAASHGARITSNSYGGPYYSQAFQDAINVAYELDVVTIASAGNGATMAIQYPAGYDRVLSISAIDHDGELAGFSNHGPFVDIAGPGVAVLSCAARSVHPSGYAVFSGTSMSCPHVSGVAALIRSRDRDASARAVMSALRTAVEPLDTDRHAGSGLINAHKAVRRAHNPDIEVELDPNPEFSAYNPVNSTALIRGTVDGPDLQSYVVEIGFGPAPTSWTTIGEGDTPVVDGVLGELDLSMSQIATGRNTVRLRAFDADGRVVSDRFALEIDNLRFDTPSNYDIYRAGDLLEITGATGAAGFTSYEIECRPFEIDNGGFIVHLGPWSTDGIVLEHGGTQALFGERLATWDTSVLEHQQYLLRLTVNGDSVAERQTQVYLEPTMREGWPVRIAHDVETFGLPNVLEPLLVDFDGNGLPEIYALQSAILHGFGADGAARPGFPVQLPHAPDRRYTTSSLTAADIDGDGFDEILFASVRNQTISIGAIEHDGTTTPGFPLAWTYDGAQGEAIIRPDASVVVADVDADGADELVFQAFDLLVVAETDGTLLTGALVHLRPGATEDCGEPYAEEFTTSIDSTPAVADLDGDAALEIAVFHQTPDCGAFWTADRGVMMVLDPDGTIVWQTTTRYTALGSSPAIGDLDGDGDQEIVVAAGDLGTGQVRDGGVHAFDGATGAVLPGFPWFEEYYGFTGSPALADLDGNGDLEILVPDAQLRSLICVNHDGSSFIPDYNGFFALSGPFTVAVTDVDQDGLPDVTSSENRFPFSEGYGGGLGAGAFDATGAALDGFPKVTESNAWVPIQVADLDGDGLLEAIASCFKEVGDGTYSNDDFKHRGSIYVWELGVPDMGMPQEWPTFHGNYRRTGRYGD